MEQNLVIGIDVGGQTTKCGVVDARGTVLAQTVIRSDSYTTVEPYIEELAAALKKIITDAGAEGQIRGIGVGAPNANYYTGEVENAVNLSWGRAGSIPFAKMLTEAMGGIPVTLTNDANAAAMGEMTYGAARGMKNFIMITLGTGVGSGIVINGEMVYGHDGFAGELGHVIVKEDGRELAHLHERKLYGPRLVHRFEEVLLFLRSVAERLGIILPFDDPLGNVLTGA